MTTSSNLKLFCGENSFVLLRALDELKRDFVAREGDLNLAVLDGQTVDENTVITASETMPFLGSQRLTIVQDWDFGRPSTRLSEFVKAVPETTILVLTASKPDGRVSLYKNCKKYGEIREFGPLKPAEYIGFLRGEAAQAKIAIEPAALQLLATYTSGDAAAGINELKKLSLYSGDQPITRETVAALTHPDLHTIIFDLTDAVSTRQPGQAIRILHDLQQRGENLVQILAMIVRQFRILLQLQIAVESGMARSALASELRLHPFVVQKTVDLARKFSVAELKQVLRDLLRIDTGFKSGEIHYSAGDQSELTLAIEKLIVKLAV